MALRSLMIGVVMASQFLCYSEVYGKSSGDVRDQITPGAVDSVMIKNLGEKMSDIIMNSDSAKVTAISYVEGMADKSVILDSLLGNVVRYTFRQPDMYDTNKKIYMSFEPWTVIDFYKNDDHISILLDFAMNKWKAKKADGNEICTFDMPAGSLLLIMNILFPENEDFEQQLTKYFKEK